MSLLLFATLCHEKNHKTSISHFIPVFRPLLTERGNQDACHFWRQHGIAATIGGCDLGLGKSKQLRTGNYFVGQEKLFGEK